MSGKAARRAWDEAMAASGHKGAQKMLTERSGYNRGIAAQKKGAGQRARRASQRARDADSAATSGAGWAWVDAVGGVERVPAWLGLGADARTSALEADMVRMRGAITQAAVEEMGGYGNAGAGMGGDAVDDDDEFSLDDSDGSDSDADFGASGGKGAKRGSKGSKRKGKSRAKTRRKPKRRGGPTASASLPAHHALALGSRPLVPLGAALDRDQPLGPTLDDLQRASAAAAEHASGRLHCPPSAPLSSGSSGLPVGLAAWQAARAGDAARPPEHGSAAALGAVVFGDAFAGRRFQVGGTQGTSGATAASTSARAGQSAMRDEGDEDLQSKRGAHGPDDTNRSAYIAAAAGPPLRPARRRCVVTGLPARFKERRTGQRFATREAFNAAKERLLPFG